MERVLAELKAGRLVRTGATLAPDAEKGELRVVSTPDGFTHVTWSRRGATAVADAETDVIIFPAEARLVQMPVAGFCVQLRFEGQTGRNVCFYSQEGASVDASAKLAAFNAALGSVEAASPAAAAGGSATPAPPAGAAATPQAPPAPARAPAPAAADASPALARPSPQQTPRPQRPQPGSVDDIMARLLGARAEASPAQAQVSRLAAQLAAAMTATLPPSVVAAGVAAAAAKQQGRGGKAGGNGSGGGGGGGGRAVPAGPPLESVLTSDVFIAELRSPSTRDALAQARRAQRSEDDVAALPHSAVFKSQVAAFGRALQSGSMDPSQLGLPPTSSPGVVGLMEALRDQADRARADAAAAAAAGAPGAPGAGADGADGEPMAE